MKKFHILLCVLFIFSISFARPGKVVQKFKSPSNFPTGLTFDGSNLWLADYKEDKLFCINPADGEIIRSIPSPGFWPMGLAFDGKYLWNVDIKQSKIFKVDPNDGTILFAIDAPTANPEGLTWYDNTLWVTDYREDLIMKIDLSDGTNVKSFIAPAGYIQGLTYDGEYFWCTDRIQDEIYMVDAKNGEVIIVVDSPAPYPRGIAYDGTHLWVVDYQTDSLYKMIRKDDQLYTLEDIRKSVVTLTNEVKPYGDGNLLNLDVYFALPVDLPQQKILNIEYNPEPKFVTDRWNQEFANFNYTNKPAGSTIQSKMIVESEISAINYYIFPNNCGTLADIPADIKEAYTSNESKYQLEDEFIQKKAKEIVGDEQNPYWAARKIFDYVRNTLEYKLEGGWNVAPVVLQRGTGSCSEYTFSFIALCRAAGIPARYVGAIVVRGDDASFDDVFHRWPEIYLPNYGWIPIDPQGGDKEIPRDRAMNIGHLSNRFLITTHSGGDSEYMGWYYNSHEKYKTDPQVKVNIENFAEWEPIE